MIYTLSLRLKDRLNWLMSRVSSNSPTWGSLVLIMATRAANTGVNGSDAACAFIRDLARSPLPLIRFSANNSGTTFLIFVTLTRLTIPVKLLRSASHDKRWCSGLDLSSAAAACNARSRAGGMYTPPDLLDTSFANSAWASKTCFSGLEESRVLSARRRASWRSRSRLRAGSLSLTLGRSSTVEADARRGEAERRLLAGGGDGELRGEPWLDLDSRTCQICLA
jgi:hypothetical protein